MIGFLQRLKQRKIVQWAIAYVAFSFALLQALDLVAQHFDWPGATDRYAILVLAVGFCVLLLLAWYHGERGGQRVGSMEIMLLALLLAIGGVLIWRFGPAATRHRQTLAVQPVRASTAAPASAAASPAASPLSHQRIPAKSVAVLPFENLSADKNNAYFADGMQDLILTKLADIGDLKVISRTSTEQYGSHPGNLRKIARELGVATILEGSVQKAGKQVLINVQLIDAKTDGHIWAQSYQRTLNNIFGVEGEVADKVATALNAKLTAKETAEVTRIPTTNPKAYTLYLKAVYENNTAYSDDQPTRLWKAEQYFKQAVAQDPRFALAYARLAGNEISLLATRVSDSDALLQSAVSHARKALKLEPGLVMAHLALGDAQGFRYPTPASMQELRTAARMAPNNATVRNILTQRYARLGDWQQAAEEIKQALRADPHDWFNYLWSARIDAALQRYPQARQALEQALAINPDSPTVRVAFGHYFMLVGDSRAAREQFAKMPNTLQTKYIWLSRTYWLARGHVHMLAAAARIGNSGSYTQSGIGSWLVGLAAFASGDKPRSRAALEKSRNEIHAALKQHPKAYELYQRLALIDAFSSHRSDALGDIQTALSLAAPGTTADPMAAMKCALTKAQVLAHFDDPNGAVATLRKLIATPGSGAVVTLARLRLDPFWDPIRHDPAFQALLKKYASAQPASGSSGAAQ